MNQIEKIIKEILDSHKSLLENTTLGAWDIYYTLEEDLLNGEKINGTENEQFLSKEIGEKIQTCMTMILHLLLIGILVFALYMLCGVLQ